VAACWLSQCYADALTRAKEDRMFNYLCNPSAAIRKRLSLLDGKNGVSEQDESGIHKIKTVAECFSIVDKMTSENVLFHGYDSLENCIKVFAEYAVDKKEEHYQKCLDIIESKKDGDSLYKRGITKNAELFEGKGYSASKAIRASLLICSGIESEKETKLAIQHSMECFKAVLAYERIEDYAYQKNGKWIYRDGKLFPDYYNLRILALSSEWKNEETIRILTESVNRLAMLQPIPSIFVKVRSQLIAPGSYLMHDFDSSFSDNDDNKKAEWLIRNEYFSRMGVLNNKCNLRKVKESINDKKVLVESMLSIKNNYAFTKWGASSGVSLDDDWLKKERRINDLAFRIGLISHYSNENFA